MFHGVDEKGSYTVDITQVLDDVRVWRVITNGYPYKTPSQMGVETEEDAYMTTKQAIYAIIFNRDVTSQYRGKDTRGQKMVNAMVNLVNIGRYGTQTPEQSNLGVTKVGNLTESGDYYYQEFKVTSSVNISEYKILSTSNMPTNSYIANMSGNKTDKFSGTEHFKLMIPKTSLNVDISNVAIRVQGKCKTYPVFFGKSPVSSWQDYAVTFDPYGDDNAVVQFSQKTNVAKIIVNKQDEETKQPIANTTFQLCKKDGTVIANATTNSKGIVEFTGLYQGSYILKEIASNEKYVLDTKEINIELNYAETKTLTVTNEHKKGNLKVFKVDKDNSNVTIGGVIFDLYSEEFNKVVGTYTTNANGEISIDGLRIRKLLFNRKSYK